MKYKRFRNFITLEMKETLSLRKEERIKENKTKRETKNLEIKTLGKNYLKNLEIQRHNIDKELFSKERIVNLLILA